MKNVLFLFLFLIVTQSANSQGFSWDVRTGFGIYDLKDIKALQLELIQATNLTHIKPVERFPNSIFYSISSNYSIRPKHTVGFDFSYYTTGGRNHIKDYSGEYKLDMLLNGYRGGTKYMYYNRVYDKIYFGVQLGGGCIFSNLDIDENLKVVDEVITDEAYEFTSWGLYIEPSVLLSYNLFKDININLTSGYEKDFEGELHSKKDKNQKLDRTIDWSGLKISLGINYRLNFEKKSTDINNQGL